MENYLIVLDAPAITVDNTLLLSSGGFQVSSEIRKVRWKCLKGVASYIVSRLIYEVINFTCI